MTGTSPPLSAPFDVGFDYTRTLGPVLGPFATALRDGRVLGIRGTDRRVHVPVVEFDPVTGDALDELVEVSDFGTVVTWTWQSRPSEGQPLDRSFAWAMIRLDGADTPLLHAVDTGSAEAMWTGMRVRIRWADERSGSITDIACFVPADSATASEPEAPAAASDAAPVTTVVTPIHLHLRHSASAQESDYLRALEQGRLLAQRCTECDKVYIPPRGACPTCGVPTTEPVELPDTGTVTTFCIVNVPFLGQRIAPPYVAAYILLDGADIAFLHLVLGCDAAHVRMGMRVRAVWKPREDWSTTMENIDHFAPTGEPDAADETYAHHL
ncbi:DNA-binding protein [Allosaccharopolyspora coralli]|uniref:DNA-binding protein n=1 Tax=Allosaccharopolyspora coralli TaxID=2665642 RepID=A0A5Q3QAH6_9PSEU|nr:OB-fold nucleic acid binding domain-containing protein [Allosaccharopolyspora coralli]QGK70366.1 DNA-binding protein [Allosaccharopolyspora coralli]